jgi:hypothetical protein
MPRDGLACVCGMGFASEDGEGYGSRRKACWVDLQATCGGRGEGGLPVCEVVAV